MAERNERYRGLFLHAKDTARGDRIVTFLCKEGILSLFLFGGPKSSLRSVATPYILADIEVYHDRRNDFSKLTGATILETFDSLHTSFSHMQAAAAAAEFVIRTSAFGGEYGLALQMITTLLRELPSIEEDSAPYAMYAFLWNALAPQGLAPDISACEHCGKRFTEQGALPGRLLAGERSFLCARCAEERRREGFPASAMILIDAMVLQCLREILDVSYSQAARCMSVNPSLLHIEAIIESLAESAAEGPLQSLRLFH